MFLGHYGLAFGVKKANPKPSLWVLFMAAQFLDLLWPIFLLLGWEKIEITNSSNPLTNITFTSYPYSHSLLFALIWSLVFGLVYLAIKRDGRTAILLGFLAFSHWILDYLVHVPDLQLTPWTETRVGLGLWNSVQGTLAAEGILYVGGIALYLSATRAKSWVGHVSLWSLVIVLAGFYASTFFSPPPSTVQSMGWMGLGLWLIVLWAYWIDRTRVTIV